MKARYIDAHCHLQFDHYSEDQDELIGRMKEEGVVGIVVGCDFVSSQKAVALAEKHEHLFASIGLHPNHEGTEAFDVARYRDLAKSAKVVAVGECGLDYFRPHDVTDEVKEKQKELFTHHIRLAAELDTPLVIHTRPSKGTMDAYRDVIDLLKEAKKKYPNVRGDVHFFVGGIDEMRELAALGFAVSFTAVITFARDYDAVIRAAPLANILAETDAPYVAPKSRRGERNDPFAVIDVVEKIAVVRGEDTETVRSALVQSAKGLFALPIEP